GTGLGLYICHEIIQRHGGTITVEKSDGEGAKFIVKLPVNA
ncbi:MAG: histidine kinase, partial [Proteobacteria bacterium]|nr:histidine kinase [Pseudomonadota bacterium]MBU4012447.1 histidine kinase [Pseudomonadota bacterium]MBU4067578.1 histidine kinase [Pseudomonadota bacterium]